MSVLSNEADGAGCFYGWYKDHRIDVRYEWESVTSPAGHFAYVDGNKLPERYLDKTQAEKAATDWIDQLEPSHDR